MGVTWVSDIRQGFSEQTSAGCIKVTFGILTRPQGLLFFFAFFLPDAFLSLRKRKKQKTNPNPVIIRVGEGTTQWGGKRVIFGVKFFICY